MKDTETRWLDPQQQRHWRALVRGMALLNEHLDRDLESETGLRLNEYEVMVRLSEVPDRRMRRSSLADERVHSRSWLSHTISRMEAKGLVHRFKDDGDGRGVHCVLTDAGYAALESASHTHVASVRDRLVDVVTDDELAVLGQAFATIARTIEGRRYTPQGGPVALAVADGGSYGAQGAEKSAAAPSAGGARGASRAVEAGEGGVAHPTSPPEAAQPPQEAPASA